jgi:dienelactone hydrolase
MKRIGIALAGLVLLYGTPAQAQAARQPPALVLIPGAGGASPRDFLVLSQGLFEASGFVTEMTTGASHAAALVAGYKARGQRVTLVGMSLGAATAAQALAAGAQPDRVVFAAGGLLPPGTPNGAVRDLLGDPARLPRTLVLHHREDACHLTPPGAVAEFVRWSGGRARTVWITGGVPAGLSPPCRPGTPHTFAGREQAAASAIMQFARGR